MKQTRMILLMMAMIVPIVFAGTAYAGTSGPSPIPNPPSFQVTTNTLVLCKGQVNYIPVTLINSGSPSGAINNITMDSLVMIIAGSKYLSPVNNGTAPSVTLPRNSSITETLPAFVSLNATTFLGADIEVSYNYLNYYSDIELRNVSFSTESCPSALAVSVTPKTLVSGKIENVSFTLTNGGVSAISDLSFKASLSPQDGQILTSQPVLVGSIPSFGSTTINEILFINTTSETFPINTSISFYNGTRLEQMADSIAVLSSGIINLTSTSVTVSPTAPTVGSIFSISFVLTNLGTTSASAVTATVLPPSGMTAFGSNSVFVGSIGVNTQTPVTLTLTSSSSTKGGSYVIPIRITYLNNLRQQVNSTITVPVTIRGGALSSNSPGRGSGVVVTSNGTTYAAHRSSGGGLIIIILIIIVVVVAYLFLRERRQHRKTKEAIAASRK